MKKLLKEPLTEKQLADKRAMKWLWIAIVIIPCLTIIWPLKAIHRNLQSPHRTLQAWLPGTNIVIDTQKIDWQVFVRDNKGVDYQTEMFLEEYRSTFTNNDHKVMVSFDGVSYSTHQGKHRFFCFEAFVHRNTIGFGAKVIAIKGVKNGAIDVEIGRELDDTIELCVVTAVVVGGAIDLILALIVTSLLSWWLLRRYGPDPKQGEMD